MGKMNQLNALKLVDLNREVSTKKLNSCNFFNKILKCFDEVGATFSKPIPGTKRAAENKRTDAGPRQKT